MRGHDFLEVAKNLIKSQFEASIRSAISRAYYALLNSAAELLMELGFSVEQGPGVHGQIRNRLSNSNAELLVEFAHVFDELRTQRNAADYNMKSQEFKNQAACALRIAKAQLVLGFLAECNKEPLRSQIRTAIREYDRKIGSHS